jgi:hypothetical protein
MASSSHKFRIGYIRNASWGRAIVTPIVLLTFLLQIFAVQTHVHFSAANSATSAAGIYAPSRGFHTAPVATLGSDWAKTTKGGDTTDCPLCQAVLSSGSYLAPAISQIHLPIASIVLDPIAYCAIVIATVSSHAWQSRAPPTA